MVGAATPLTAQKAGQLTMVQIVFIGLGAGIASALLFASVASGSPISIFLFLLPPPAAVGVPAYLIAYVAMLGRHAPDGTIEWYPAGKLVLWAAGIAAVSTALTIPVFGSDLDSYRATVKQIFARVIRLQLGTPAGEPL